ncbi:hypothetical protein [Marinobacter xestospongiae]|uniref:Uncharacterized protein n=1 Tax=Marinobacter xestospongiae TaxID=994319 RepID=A0ABU3W3Z7_9GAMM|nr:hypothetical protein [Marinobacter xestospongiae]MDV2081065.1 hypothetical protein [Marinobacter xestospongiae]
MKTIEYEDLDGLCKWIDFFVNEREVWLEKTDCQLKMFGDGDDSYLVINEYSGESNSTEYFFKPDENENNLMALIFLLKQFGFCLEALLKRLPELDYIDEDIGCYASISGIKIFKDHVVSN